MPNLMNNADSTLRSVCASMEMEDEIVAQYVAAFSKKQ